MVYECVEQTAKFITALVIDGADEGTGRRAERPLGEPRGRHESMATSGKNIFAEMHFLLACRSESCILHMRVRFTATTRAKIV
jgi:hypothetical protein